MHYVTEWQREPNANWRFQNLKYIKIKSIAEDVDPKQKEAYIISV